MTPDTYPDLFWAYTAIWLVLGVYIISLGFRLSKIEKKVAPTSDSSNSK